MFHRWFFLSNRDSKKEPPKKNEEYCESFEWKNIQANQNVVYQFRLNYDGLAIKAFDSPTKKYLFFLLLSIIMFRFIWTSCVCVWQFDVNWLYLTVEYFLYRILHKWSASTEIITAIYLNVNWALNNNRTRGMKRSVSNVLNNHGKKVMVFFSS